ncbi:MAG: LOG family protein [Candidatus Gastranaerophilales bacterium]|nr:LOG family protein [Candidatus Gastranaerophilales bacterium]
MRISPVNNRIFKQSFKANHKKENTIAILGSSKSNDHILPDIIKVSRIVPTIIARGMNIVTGCGTRGIMGQAHYTAADYSKKDSNGKPIQNLAIIKKPLWGDEDLDNCEVIDEATSENERITKFIENADSFLIFPGGPATMLEATSVISHNHYAENKKKVILVGREYFKSLDEQYLKIYEMGLLKVDPKELYVLVDSVEEIETELGLRLEHDTENDDIDSCEAQ